MLLLLPQTVGPHTVNSLIINLKIRNSVYKNSSKHKSSISRFINACGSPQTHLSKRESALNGNAQHIKLAEDNGKENAALKRKKRPKTHRKTPMYSFQTNASLLLRYLAYAWANVGIK